MTPRHRPDRWAETRPIEVRVTDLAGCSAHNGLGFEPAQYHTRVAVVVWRTYITRSFSLRKSDRARLLVDRILSRHLQLGQGPTHPTSQLTVS